MDVDVLDMVDVVAHLRLEPPRALAGKLGRRVPAYSRAAQMRDVMAFVRRSAVSIDGRSASWPQRKRHVPFR